MMEDPTGKYIQAKFKQLIRQGCHLFIKNAKSGKLPITDGIVACESEAD